MARVLNLDKVIPPNNTLLLGGERYEIPGKITVKQVLEISKLGEEVQKKPETFSNILEKLWGIIEPFNKEKNKEKFESEITLPMLSEMMAFILSGNGGEEESGLQDHSGEGSGPVTTQG